MILIILAALAAIDISDAQYAEGKNHSCYRNCAGSIPMICAYTFDVEWYQTLSFACKNCPANLADCKLYNCVAADGFARPVQTVNRKIPGPSIQVCMGDEVRVTVRNLMHSESTTIHWHGMLQKGTPYMDGVPFVTQCPINPETTFMYRFRANDYGTHFWHSHSGVQRCNGIAGPLIVRRDPFYEVRGLYDVDDSDYMIFVQDWMENESNEVELKRYHRGVDEFPRSILINGFGAYVTGVPGGTGGIPPTRYVVKPMLRYRFRIIASACMDIPIAMSVDGHKMNVMASDGADINLVECDSLTINAGERWDVIIWANKAIGIYWFRFRGMVMGELGSTFQGAVLQYEGASTTALPLPNPLTYATSGSPVINPRQVNGFNTPPNNVPLHELTNYWGAITTAIPCIKHYVTFDIREIYFPLFQLSPPPPGLGQSLPRSQIPLFNDIALKLKPYPLLSQATLALQNEYCNDGNIPLPASPLCNSTYCSCLHVLKVPYGCIVELIFVDEGVLFDVAHPIHIHGYKFFVMGSGKVVNTSSSTTEAAVRQKDAVAPGLPRTYINNIQKDTVAVPDGGYTIVRFKADNLGIWLMHCHIEFHSDHGMGMIIQVGELDEIRYNNPIPTNFPKCGDFVEAPTPPFL